MNVYQERYRKMERWFEIKYKTPAGIYTSYVKGLTGDHAHVIDCQLDPSLTAYSRISTIQRDPPERPLDRLPREDD